MARRSTQCGATPLERAELKFGALRAEHDQLAHAVGIGAPLVVGVFVGAGIAVALGAN